MSNRSADRVRETLNHRTPDRVPLDLGSTTVTGIHVSCVAELRSFYGLEKKPVRVIDPGQMLGEVDEELKDLWKIDTVPLFRKASRFGFALEGWKPWRMYDGLEVLVPGRFTVAVDEKGDTLLYPQGDTSSSPSARMPNGGYFFDAIERQMPIDDEQLDPRDNLEEFQPISDEEIVHIGRQAEQARATRRAVVAGLGGTSFGDIGHIPGVGLKKPRGIRQVEEWYISVLTRPKYVRDVFEGQCEIALQNLAKIAAQAGDNIDVVFVCGADFGTQKSCFYSRETFQDLWAPVYRRINCWIHRNTRWKTFKHSCGAIESFIEPFIDCGFDILNPVQCSAAGMDPETLKSRYGDRISFWGGGVDTQHVLPFGTPEQVREQVLHRCRTFSGNGGFVFNPVHNIQARTPIRNIVAMIDAVHEFNGE